MKNLKILIPIFFFTINMNLFSQVKLADKAQISLFLKSTTCVVKDGKPFSMFNSYLNEAIENHWNVTKVMFIDEDAFENYRQNENYSFILLSEAVFTEKKQTYKIDILNLVLGNKGKGLDNMPDLGSIPLCYTEEDEEAYLYKIPALVKILQYQVKLIKENNINSPQNLIDFHNQHKKQIKNKTLWLSSDDLSDEINTENKIKAIYPFDFKIVSMDELEAAIENSEDILFSHIIAPTPEMKNGKVWKFIIGAKDGKVYYVEEESLPNKNVKGLLKSDIESFAKY